MFFVSFRCFFSVFHTKCLGSVYATPTEHLRYALATPVLSPYYIKHKNRPCGRFCNGSSWIIQQQQFCIPSSLDGRYLLALPTAELHIVGLEIADACLNFLQQRTLWVFLLAPKDSVRPDIIG